MNQRILLIIIFIILITGCTTNVKKGNKLKNLTGLSISKIKQYETENNLDIIYNYEYSYQVNKDLAIDQLPKEGTIITKKAKITVSISKGKIPKEDLQKDKINELGTIPIFMYHGIENTTNKYTGGNIDKDGYNRTSRAFKEDLERYYNEGYEAIRLIDLVTNNLDVSYGKSPIIFTFDDGKKNNCKVISKKNGELEIDPESACGIMEIFKKTHPDFKITATFFLNSTLFNQKEYNEDIIKWLIEKGYDIGNHTKTHPDFTKINETETAAEIVYMYQTLDTIIPDKYVKIIALPFGSPYKKDHSNFNTILHGSFNGYDYNTLSTLKVGANPSLSPNNISFDKTFLPRIRAWDNNGTEDIIYWLNNLKATRYISDGLKDVITIPENKSNSLKETNLIINKY